MHYSQRKYLKYSIQHLVNFTMHTYFSDDALLKVSNGAKIRNRYNQVPHLTQDTKINLWDLKWYPIHLNEMISLRDNSLKVYNAKLDMHKFMHIL